MSTKPATHVTFTFNAAGEFAEIGRYTTSQAARRAGKSATEGPKAHEGAVSFEVVKVADEAAFRANAEATVELREELTAPAEGDDVDAELVEAIGAEMAEGAEEAAEAPVEPVVISVPLVDAPERKAHESLAQAKKRIAAEKRVDALMSSLKGEETITVIPAWNRRDVDEMTGCSAWFDGEDDAPKAPAKGRAKAATGTPRASVAKALEEADADTWPMVQQWVDGAWADLRLFGKRSAIRKVDTLAAKGVKARAILKGEIVAEKG